MNFSAAATYLPLSNAQTAALRTHCWRIPAAFTTSEHAGLHSVVAKRVDAAKRFASRQPRGSRP